LLAQRLFYDGLGGVWLQTQDKRYDAGCIDIFIDSKNETKTCKALVRRGLLGPELALLLADLAKIHECYCEEKCVHLATFSTEILGLILMIGWGLYHITKVLRLMVLTRNQDMVSYGGCRF
jgi:hypothetical protein